jgi:ATP phosphoribosyltransferase
MRCQTETAVKFGVPKGRMYEGIAALLRDAGIPLLGTSRGYRPRIDMPGLETKILKPRAIIEMLGSGARDAGFAGGDWVAESAVEIVELLDTGLDPVRLIAAAPSSVLEGGALPSRRITVATEYPLLTARWIAARDLDASVLVSYGATEVLPPEDADCIVDNTATGATLTANGLEIIDELMTSSTRLYASPRALENPAKREGIERLVMLVGSVLEARSRVMIEFNIEASRLASVIGRLPCMREPTVSSLHSSAGYAVKSAVPRAELPSVIPEIKSRGGTDIVVSSPEQIVL